jgi:hypothetical protein
MIAIFENFCEKFGFKKKKFGREWKFRKKIIRYQNDPRRMRTMGSGGGGGPVRSSGDPMAVRWWSSGGPVGSRCGPMVDR